MWEELRINRHSDSGRSLAHELPVLPALLATQMRDSSHLVEQDDA